MAIGAKMPRTVRLALWTGEEEGLLGSKAYVKEHFADPEVMKLKPEHNKVSAYYNLDNGTGKIRGIYLQGNDMVRPIFDSWLSAFKDLGVETVIDPQHRRYGSLIVRCGRNPGLPVHPGPGGVCDSYASLQHGSV